jgi:hypothetical protein
LGRGLLGCQHEYLTISSIFIKPRLIWNDRVKVVCGTGLGNRAAAWGTHRPAGNTHEARRLIHLIYAGLRPGELVHRSAEVRPELARSTSARWGVRGPQHLSA